MKPQPRKALQLMAAHQERKLLENDHKVPWEESSNTVDYLLARLLQEYEELQDAVRAFKNCPIPEIVSAAQKVVDECADVNNFSTMIAAKFDHEMRRLHRGKEVDTQ